MGRKRINKKFVERILEADQSAQDGNVIKITDVKNIWKYILKDKAINNN